MTTKERIKNWKIHPSMRGEFGFELYKQMAQNPNIFLLTGDLGWGLFDAHRDDFPDRFINCGAAEQAMLDIAVGLALEGKIPIVYSITPFLLYRPFETWRTYVNRESIPIIGIGSGRDDDYKHDGFSHYAGDDKHLPSWLTNITFCWPKDTQEMKRSLEDAIRLKRPYYINLMR